MTLWNEHFRTGTQCPYAPIFCFLRKISSADFLPTRRQIAAAAAPVPDASQMPAAAAPAPVPDASQTPADPSTTTKSPSFLSKVATKAKDLVGGVFGHKSRPVPAGSVPGGPVGGSTVATGGRYSIVLPQVYFTANRASGISDTTTGTLGPGLTANPAAAGTPTGLAAAGLSGGLGGMIHPNCVN